MINIVYNDIVVCGKDNMASIIGGKLMGNL